MILEVVKYGHPVLRASRRPDREKFDTGNRAIDRRHARHHARGQGRRVILAAQQIGKALQLTVLDVRGIPPERPSTLGVAGKLRGRGKRPCPSS